MHCVWRYHALVRPLERRERRSRARRRGVWLRLDAANADTNFLTSPISASIALTMTYAGAANATATEMASALHFPSGAGASIFDGQTR